MHAREDQEVGFIMHEIEQFLPWKPAGELDAMLHIQAAGQPTKALLVRSGPYNKQAPLGAYGDRADCERGSFPGEQPASEESGRSPIKPLVGALRSL
jgi:hypothetical protein